VKDAPGAEARDAQLHVTGRGGQQAIKAAVAVVTAMIAALITLSP
jgi:hypothetical protein